MKLNMYDVCGRYRMLVKRCINLQSSASGIPLNTDKKSLKLPNSNILVTVTKTKTKMIASS